MLATLRRLRVLAAWLAVCVGGGPSAAAMCAHAAPAQAPPPCHESGGDMAMEDMAMEHETAPAPAHAPSDASCVSACCAGLSARAEASVVVPDSAPAPVVREVVTEAPVWVPVVAAVAARAHPPPGPTLLDTVRLRI